jgi:hypothetical protein
VLLLQEPGLLFLLSHVQPTPAGKCLSQLALTDAGSLHKTALYLLATADPASAPSALQRFRNVVLVASQQVSQYAQP